MASYFGGGYFTGGYLTPLAWPSYLTGENGGCTVLIGYKRGQTSVVLRVKLRDSSDSTGAGLTGLTSASAGLIISTIADNEASATVYAQASSNIETITTLGTYAAPTASKCRFKEVDATNHKGVYEIQIANARFAVSSTKSLLISISGATNLAECDVVIPLTDVDPYDAVRFGMTALPNVTSGSAGAVITSGTGTAQLSVSSGQVLIQSGTGTGQLDFTSGVVKANVTQLLGTAWLTPGTAGTPDVNVKLWNGLTTVALPLVPTTAGRTLDVSAGGEAGLDWANIGSPTTSVNLSGTTVGTATNLTSLPASESRVLQTGTASAGSASSITIATALGADAYGVGCIIRIRSGTGAGQARIVKGYTNSTKVITLDADWNTAPDNTSVYDIFSDHAPAVTSTLGVDVRSWRGNTVPSPNVTGVPLVDAGYWKGGTIVTPSTAGVPSVDSMYVGGSAATTTGGKLDVNLVMMNGDTDSATGLTSIGTEYSTNNYVSSNLIAINNDAGAAAGLAAAGGNYYLDGWFAANITATSGASVVGDPGYIGIDWGTIANADAAQSLSNTEIGFVLAVQSGAITNLSFASGAITAAAIATDAIGSAELAASAVAKIATGIWQDTTAGDFTTAGSIGKSLFTSGVAPGGAGGLFIAGTNAATTVTTSFTTTFTGNLTGSVGSVTGLTASNLDATISSRMATYTQPTGFLAATFPSGTVANTTNITAGTITTVTNLTNAPTSGDFTAVMKTSLNAATPTVTLSASESNVLQTGTATAGSANTITIATALGADGLCIGQLIRIRSGTGAGQARTISNYVNATKVVTVAEDWVVTPDNTSVYDIRSAGNPDWDQLITVNTGLSSSLDLVSGSVVDVCVSAVWERTLSHLGYAANSAGRLLYDVSGWVGNAGSGLTSIGDGRLNNLDATISSRMATFTLPTNFSSLGIDASGRVDIGKILGTASAGVAGYVGIDWSHINAPTTTVNLSGTTVGTVTTLTGYSSPPSAASIATAVWQDTTSGDFTVASSIGKSLYTSGVAPGAAGGLFIAGTNAATTITTGLTTTFTGNLTGSVGSVTGLTASNLDATISSRMASYTQPTGFLAATFPGTVASTTNITAGTITTVTNLTNAPTAGDFTATMKTSLNASTPTVVLSSADSCVLQSGTAAAGTGSTITIATAIGADNLPNGCVIRIRSGTGAGQARVILGYVNSTKVVTVDRAWTTTPDNTSVYDIWYDSLPALNSSLKVAGVVLTDTLTTYTGNTVQTGDSFARIGSTGSGLTSLAPSSTALSTAQWTNTRAGNLDNLDAAISSRMATYTQPTGFLAATFPTGTIANTTNITAGTITTVTNQLTAAQIATGVWQDATSGDFTVASSIGKSLYTAGAVPGAASGLLIAGSNAATTFATLTSTGAFTINGTSNVAQTGDSYARLGAPSGASVSADILAVKNYVDDIGVAGAGLTALGDTRLANLDATVSSRMATYTQPTGFLAATFPGTVASTTNITAGTITTVTNLTNAPTSGDFTAVMKTSLNAATPTVVLSSADSCVLQSGTATAGGASTITIQTAIGADNLPNGCVIRIRSGTGAGQARGITGYVNSTKVVTVDRAWTTNPDNTSVYDIWYDSLPSLNASLKVSGVVLTDTLTTYTGNTVQTGDSYARIGATGSGLTSLAPSATALSTATWTGTRAGYLDNLSGGAVALASTALSTAQWTNTRAGNLDNLDAAISTRMATFTLPTNFSSLSIDASGRVDIGKILGTASAGVAGYVGIDWSHINAPTTTVALSGTTVGTVTTLTNTPSDSTGVTTLLSRLTSGRATNLDNLDATVSSRLATVGYTAPPSSATISAAVWDLTLAGHTTSGTTGAALNAASSAGDPWGTTLPGAYGAGTAGYLLGTNLNATVSSRMATFALPTNFSSLSIDASGRVDLGKILGAVSTGAAGYVGIDWGNIHDASATVALGNTTVGTVTNISAVTTVTTVNNLAVGAIDAIVAAVFSKVIGHGTRTFENHQIILGAAVAGLHSGNPTSSLVFRDLDDTRDVILGTVDEFGNRLAATFNP